MKTPLTILILIVAVLASGCSRGPKPIDFGNELCHFCKMTISDPKFGAEIVTTTGKTFKFDAAECMIWQMEEGSIEKERIHQLYVIAFDKPTNLVPVEKASFLISGNQPSPMGAYLSAYADKGTAIKAQQQVGGEVMPWNRVKDEIEKQ